jgi:hypothetical protein
MGPIVWAWLLQSWCIKLLPGCHVAAAELGPEQAGAAGAVGASMFAACMGPAAIAQAPVSAMADVLCAHVPVPDQAHHHRAAAPRSMYAAHQIRPCQCSGWPSRTVASSIMMVCTDAHGFGRRS